MTSKTPEVSENTHKSIEEIAREVEEDFQAGGLSSGLYFDFAESVAQIYAQQQVVELIRS